MILFDIAAASGIASLIFSFFSPIIVRPLSDISDLPPPPLFGIFE
jgi:hypothetical protein